MKERDADFELWWRNNLEEGMPTVVRKTDAMRIWNAAFKAGGAQPWWSITQEQWAVLNKKFGGEG
jgi:hypothetical protein